MIGGGISRTQPGSPGTGSQPRGGSWPRGRRFIYGVLAGCAAASWLRKRPGYFAIHPVFPVPDSLTYSVVEVPPFVRRNSDPTRALTTPSGELVPTRNRHC